MEHIGHFPTSMEMCMDDHLTLTTEKTQQKQFQDKVSEQCCSTHSISLDSQKNTVLSHAEFPLSMESMPFFPRETVPAGKREIHTARHRKHAIFPRESIPARRGEIHIGTKLKPFIDTCTSTSSKDTHKKGRMTATIGMTDITPRTVNMVTTHILMSVHSQDSFSKKSD